MATLLKTDRHGTPPTLAEIEALADEAFQSLPDPLKLFAREVVLHVDDFPDEETLAEMECESPFDLMGLYRGVANLNVSVLEEAIASLLGALGIGAKEAS